MKNEVYKCGHPVSESVARNLGRGATRIRRIAHLAKFHCEDCRHGLRTQTIARTRRQL